MADVAMKSGNLAYRAGSAVAVVASLLIGWVNLAVGIAGNEENPVNLSFFMLVAMAGAGAFAAEFRATGTARTMRCVAAMQLMLGLIVATGPVAAGEPAGPLGLLALNGAFALLWLAAAALFAKAARARSDAR